MKIIECVPNFSDGINHDKIKLITDSITAISGVNLLDVDPGPDTNRTVVTFVGDSDPVLEAAFCAIKTASEVIDMRNHTGTHARMGATDVCPFVPVSGVSMEECIELSKMLAKQVGEELKIPVFLYEQSASNHERQNLSFIRQGEFEGMPEKLKDLNWKPDFGPSTCHKTAGVTAIGARQFLIAYNINLNTVDRKIASDIALDIREAGRAKRDINGKIVRDKSDKIIKVPGTLKSTKAVGWFLDEYNIAQVSINLVDYTVTSIHTAFEEVRIQARKRGVRVTGSELVGLIPKEAMLNAGIFYLKNQKRSIGIPEKDIIHIAVKSLGLDDIEEFDPNKKIIEYLVTEKYGDLASSKIHDFIDELSTESPAPGGGSVSALAGALASGLTAMVANLTTGKKGFEKSWVKMEYIASEAQNIKDTLINLIDADTNAFDNLMDAFRLPKKTESQKAYRNTSIQKATKSATEVPFNILLQCITSMKLAIQVAEEGNPNSISDAGVAGEMATAGGRGAAMNVKINLQSIEDRKFVTSKLKSVNKRLSELEDLYLKINKIITKML